MCGIFAVYDYNGDVVAFRERAVELSQRLRHRGPDWSGCQIANKSILCHERLAIVDLATGDQPFVSKDGSIVLVTNGEIYNHKELRKQFSTYEFSTKSDSEVIIPLYEKYGLDTPKYLDGMFSFILLDVTQNRLLVARDPIGITSLYQGWNSKQPGTVYVASELKSLNEECDKIIAFPPGHIYDSATKGTTRYFQPSWWDPNNVPTRAVNYEALRNSLVTAVHKRLMSEVPFGVLLSGGLDSSLIASIAQRFVKNNHGEFFQQKALKSFAIGLKGSPDLIAARKVADHLGTEHYEFTFTVQDGIDAIPDVIYHLETYDVTTIRASTPMYLLSRKIKSTGVKMVLSGEGSDEIFGGYLYFHAAPDAKSLHAETVSRVKNLHTSDCLRANKSTMAWGLEARVPFLDKAFLEEAMTINPDEKMYKKGRMEKYILRKAFDTDENPYLPADILWRQKEQFSDGVGYSWIDTLKSKTEAHVSDEEMRTAAKRWPRDTPQTKEAYWYRHQFEKIFPQEACTESVVRWIPRADWGCPSDPSGRAQKVHAATNATSSVPKSVETASIIDKKKGSAVA
eukprot:Phypoly_transcript_05971.p1 GENE.Phypoly_transcript_05971~~Phypoly_transcript_05971.p1  ORF type:complete len:568 (+),score=114.15 Phypoly_transcript_05971:66-1769(+)